MERELPELGIGDAAVPEIVPFAVGATGHHAVDEEIVVSRLERRARHEVAGDRLVGVEFPVRLGVGLELFDLHVVHQKPPDAADFDHHSEIGLDVMLRLEDERIILPFVFRMKLERR